MTGEWTRYWRAADRPLEAMFAHFTEHRYHRHSHETYSFGVTEQGAQSFSCRGGSHTSAAGMVMALNPDEPHDGHAASELGFTYRIVHIGPSLVPGMPLFVDPVVHDPVLARALRRLHISLLEGSRLQQDELLATAVAAMVNRATARPLGAPRPPGRRDAGPAAAAVRNLLDARYAEDLSAEDLATATGLSRFAVYRAFRTAYGMSPSDYQRQRRLRAARRMLADDHPLATIAAEVGFADQAHLTRWFGRYYGITPTGYRRAAFSRG